MKKIAVKSVYVLLLALLTSSAQAGSLYCNGGTVAQLSYHGRGQVYVRMSNMNTGVAICNIDAEYSAPGSLTGTTSPASCKVIFAALLAAKMAGTTVPQMLFDGDSVPANCTSFGPWAQVNLRYYDM